MLSPQGQGFSKTSSAPQLSQRYRSPDFLDILSTPFGHRVEECIVPLAVLAMAVDATTRDAARNVVAWHVSLGIHLFASNIRQKAIHIIDQERVSGAQIGILNIAADELDTLNAVYNLALKAGRST